MNLSNTPNPSDSSARDARCSLPDTIFRYMPIGPTMVPLNLPSFLACSTYGALQADSMRRVNETAYFQELISVGI